MAPGRRKPSTLRLTLRVAVVSGLATLVLLAGLVWQMVSGADPALTASQPAQGAATSAASGGTAATTTASTAGTAATAPVVSAPAPVTSSTS